MRSRKQLGKKVVKNLLLVVVVAFVFLAVVEAREENQASWRQLVNQDYTYDIAVTDTHIWQGISGGLIVRNLDSPKVYRFYHRLNSPLQASHVYSVAADQNNGIWLGTEKGAYYLDNLGNWHAYPGKTSLAVHPIKVIRTDNQGGVWFGTWGGGAFQLDQGGNWKSYNSLNSPLPGNRLNTIYPDSKGGAWFGTDGEGAAYLSPQGKWEVYHVLNSGLPANNVLELTGDELGNTWFATYLGLALRNAKGEWQVYHDPDSFFGSNLFYMMAKGANDIIWQRAAEGLPEGLISKVAVDKYKRILVGFMGQGLAIYDPAAGSWELYGQQSLALKNRTYLPSNTVNTILPHFSGDGQKKVWFGTDQGAAFWDLATGSWGELGQLTQFADGEVRKIAPDGQGGLVFATKESGLIYLKPNGSWQHYTETNSSLPANMVMDAAGDGLGGIWLGTFGGGIAHVNNQGIWQLYHEENSPLPTNYVNSVIVHQDGAKWFGLWGSGAARLNQEGRWTVFQVANSGLPVNDVGDILADRQGNVWFATWGGGVAKYNSNSGVWTVFNSANSALPSNVVRSLAIDARGWLWAATGNGAAYHDGAGWQVITPAASGLPANNIWRVAADDMGNVWLAADESGVAVYHPDKLIADVIKAVDITQRTEEIIVYLDGAYLEGDVPPVVQSGRVLVPMRFIFEALGAKVNWDQEGRKVEALLGEKVIRLKVDDQVAYIDGRQVALDVPARLVNSRTMVPVRFASESLGLRVDWDAKLRAVIISEE
jgi:ligand-binding sensor domain-containing protein